MEKIYMNENKRKKRIMNTSVVLSFVVSIFAIFSLAMFGIVSNQKTDVSYAAPPAGSFTFNLLNDIEGSDGTGNFNAPMYVANNDADNPIFCVEHNTDAIDGETYTSGDTIDNDYGLLYLLNNSYANGVKVTSLSGDNAKYVEGWITQVAIWMYLYETDETATQSTSKNYIDADSINIIKGTTKLTKFDASHSSSVEVYNGENLYTKYISGLVKKAKSAKNVAFLTVSKASDEIGKTDDDKFYQSSIITVIGDPSDALKSYAVTLSGIDGAFIVDENGNNIENTNSIAPGTKFYVRIPADKVTDKVQKLTVHVDGSFKTLAGKYYVGSSSNLQKVVSVVENETIIDDEETVEFVGTPDTGMNKAQTIYFIGLIVLLCGVGIVYANAKPVQEK